MFSGVIDSDWFAMLLKHVMTFFVTSVASPSYQVCGCVSNSQLLYGTWQFAVRLHVFHLINLYDNPNDIGKGSF